MISLEIPTSTCNRFFAFQSFIFGLYDQNAGILRESILYRHGRDYLSQGGALFGDKFVWHHQLNATLTYDVCRSRWVPNPVANYPDQGSIQGTLFGSSLLSTVSSVRGIGSIGAVGRTHEGSLYVFRAVCQPSNPNDLFEIIELSYYTTEPNRVYAMKRWVVKSISSVLPFKGRFSITYTSQTSSPYAYRMPLLAAEWWSSPPSAETIAGYWPQSYALSHGTESSQTAAMDTYSVSGGVVSPSQIESKIEELVATMKQGSSFPLQDRHYGDLALDAAEKINVNEVNMIEFLKDIRHPLEMIPKLASLRALKGRSKKRFLKGLSDDYLTVRFGLLPTISDLQDIVKAMRKLKPFVDRNGFNVYTARHDDSTVVDDVDYRLEQHLKLAIGQEDSGLLALIERLDSMGTLPTLERLWDLVPYSFLIDWFVDVGDLLERVDTRLRLLRLEIRYVTMSQKQIATMKVVPTPSIPLDGTISLVRYNRWVSDQCPAPPISAATPFRSFSHWLDLSALLVQRAAR